MNTYNFPVNRTDYYALKPLWARYDKAKIHLKSNRNWLLGINLYSNTINLIRKNTKNSPRKNSICDLLNRIIKEYATVPECLMTNIQ